MQNANCLIMDAQKPQKCRFFLIETGDDLLGPGLGMDMQIIDAEATLADLLEELDGFAAAHLADCRGCDACCQERAPLMAADIPALAALLLAGPWPAHAVCRAYAAFSLAADGAADIIMRRGADNACMLLQREGRYCTQHEARPFVCRSHFCLPRSRRIELLREALVNEGENELIRLLLAEEADGAPPLLSSPLSQLLNVEDYQHSLQRGCASYADIRLQQALSPQLWRQLRL